MIVRLRARQGGSSRSTSPFDIARQIYSESKDDAS